MWISWFVGTGFYAAISGFSGRVGRFISLTPRGLIFTLLGNGLLIGSAMAGMYGNRVKRSIFYTGSIWILTYGIMLFSLVQSYTVASCIIFFTGIAGGAFLVPINADIQKIAPDKLRGRTFACRDIFVNAMMPPLLIIGKLTTSFFLAVN